MKLIYKGSVAPGRQVFMGLGLTFPSRPIFSAIEKTPKILHEQEHVATQFFCSKKIIWIYWKRLLFYSCKKIIFFSQSGCYHKLQRYYNFPVLRKWKIWAKSSKIWGQRTEWTTDCFTEHWKTCGCRVQKSYYYFILRHGLAIFHECFDERNDKICQYNKIQRCCSLFITKYKRKSLLMNKKKKILSTLYDYVMSVFVICFSLVLYWLSFCTLQQ